MGEASTNLKYIMKVLYHASLSSSTGTCPFLFVIVPMECIVYLRNLDAQFSTKNDAKLMSSTSDGSWPFSAHFHHPLCHVS